jgi:hypothetical protein
MVNMNETDIDIKTNKQPFYNNSNPLLTGDLLFQQRIDRAIVQFNTSLVDNGQITSRLSAIESLYLDMVYFLSDEELKEVDELIDICHKSFAVICYFRNKINKSELYKENMEDFLICSKKTMTILVKKSFETGHIIQKGDKKQNGRR